MRKIKMYSVISMDGFTARMNGDTDWALKYTECCDRCFKEFFRTIDAVLVNKRHYDTLRNSREWAHWILGTIPCYVITRHTFNLAANKNIRLMHNQDGVRYPSMEQVKELQETKGGDIWLGGDHELISYFLQEEMIDEVTLVILPITLGNGLPLSMSNSHESRWHLSTHNIYKNGAIEISYKRKKTTHKTYGKNNISYQNL